MHNSDQIKKAPRAAEDVRQIFRNFRDATVAMINCDDTPKGVHDAVDAMLDHFNNELGGADEDMAVNAHRVISRVFGLNGGDDSPAPGPVVHRELRAEEFTLVDREGNHRARLHVAGGDTVLTMRDSQGRPRLRLRAGDNEAMISILGERGSTAMVAADQIERVRIGYDSAEQDPRIVIQDKDENRRVLLSVYSDGGVVEVENVDGCASIDEGGMVILDGDHKILAQYHASDEAKDRPAAAPAPEPTTIVATPRNGADDNWRARLLSDELAAKLAVKLFGNMDAYSEEADQVASVVIRIADMLAYEDDPHVRETAFHAISRAFYQRTRNGDDALTRFARAAGATFGGA